MAEILSGTILGGYHVHEELGQGGMATVYRAQQISMDRVVALKVLPEQFLNQVTSLDRFKQEASIVARLEHRAIVPVHDYGEHEGMPYLVMRYMDGGSVDDLLAHGPILPERALSILEQIAPALDYAHREGILHRDLKPSNILLDANGDAYITDFGIARIVRPNNKPLTTSGVVGTPAYMSPEQAQGHDLDGRSDVYALGVMVFEMLTGRRPFDGETPYSIAVKHVTEPPPSPCDVAPTLPRVLEPVLFRALAKDREVRYQTASDLVSELKHCFETSQVRGAADVLMDTAPSLTEWLHGDALHHRLDVSKESAAIAAPAVRRAPPDLQFVPAYVPGVRSVSGAARSRRQRAVVAAGPTWWLTFGLLVGGLLLALALGAAYFVLNDGAAGPSTIDYSATAIHKMTATKEAILGVAPDGIRMTAVPTPTPMAPPTNTPRAQ